MSCEMLLEQLRPEISAKCEEIKIKKREAMLKRFFVFSAVLLVLLPLLMIYLGFAFLTVFITVVLFGVGMLVISAPSLIILYKGVSAYAYR